MSKRTLFVEDERWAVDTYFQELEKNGFKCLLAKDGDEALEKLNSQKFDLISMDIMFPPGKALGNNTEPIKAGAKLLEMIRSGQIKNCHSNIKVIVLTAVIDYEAEDRIRKLGVVNYLKKPMEFFKVIEAFCNLK